MGDLQGIWRNGSRVGGRGEGVKGRNRWSNSSAGEKLLICSLRRARALL